MRSLKSRLFTLLLCLVLGQLFILMTTPLTWALDHSGICIGTFAAADNPHVLTGNCTVPAGQTLTIEPGVILTYTPSGGIPSRSLSVNGELLADGIDETNVRIFFNAGSSGNIRNSTLRSALSITDTSPTITGNTFLSSINIFASTNGTAQPLISNNTITSSSSFASVSVSGRAAPTIRQNTFTQGGLAYQEATAGSAIDNVFNNGASIQVQSAASPLIESNTFNDRPAFTGEIPISFSSISPTSTVRVRNNTICVTASDLSLSFHISFFSAPQADVSGNSFPCGLASGFGISAGTLSANAQLREVEGQRTFNVTSFIAIPTGTTLSIPAGFSFVGHGSLTLFEVRGGALLVDGAIFDNVPIWFLNTGSRGTIANSTFLHSSAPEQILVSAGSPAIIGNIFVTGGNVTGAIRVNGPATNVHIDGNTFRDIFQTAISIGNASATSTVSHNIFDNGTYALSFGSAAALFTAFPDPTLIHTNVTVGARDKNMILVPSVLDVSGILHATPFSYFGASSISPDVIVTAEPGVFFRNHGPLIVNGALIAQGTPEHPVIFTSRSPKIGGRWDGLRINGPGSILSSCIIDFASSSFPALRITGVSPTVTNCLIADNSSVGVLVENGGMPVISESTIVQNTSHGVNVTSGARPTIRRNSIFGNGANGVNRTDCTTANDLTFAAQNYWGHDSGPLDNGNDQAGGGLFNPLGQGEEVSNCVDYDPWIRTQPSIRGWLAPISGGGQVGMAGTCLPEPVIVGVQDFLTFPLANIEVFFSVIEGSGRVLEDQPVVTGLDGRASVTVCLGLTSGPVTVAVTARDVRSPLATFFVAGSAAGSPLTVAFVSTPLTLQVKRQKKGQPGDVNNDGKVNNLDAVLLQAVLDGLLPPDAAPAMNSTASGDLNRDGYINEADVHTMRGVAVGLAGGR